jgi:hypothetical protein
MEDNQIVEKRKIYQALGILSGILELAEDHWSSLLVRGQTYSVTVSKKVREKHLPGQLQNFKIYPAILEGELGFSLRLVTQTAPREVGMLLRGCWEIHEEEPRLVIYRNRRTKCKMPTVLPLIWKEAPVADGQYWEIEAKLEGDKFEVVQAIGPFDPPQKYQKRVEKNFANAKSDLPRPILKGDRTTAIKSDTLLAVLKSVEPKAIKSELPPPTLKSAKTSIAPLAPMAIDPPESESIAENASDPIALNASQVIEETTVAVKAVDVIEPIASSKIKAVAPASKESIATLAPMEIEPEETEASPVVAEAVTPKGKKVGSKSSASKKLSISPENAEPKKTKEKVKASSSKKPMSLATDGSAGVKVDRLFLGKQLPPGK